VSEKVGQLQQAKEPGSTWADAHSQGSSLGVEGILRFQQHAYRGVVQEADLSEIHFHFSELNPNRGRQRSPETTRAGHVDLANASEDGVCRELGRLDPQIRLPVCKRCDHVSTSS
jgi:hypothetical protein